MSLNNTDPIVSTDWLFDHLDAPDARVIDASWYLPAMQRDARAEYASAHIPGTVFFDLEELCDKDCGLPHMLPRPEMFASRMRRMGLGNGNRIVCYDGAGIFSAARAWWMFRAMGHKDVAVLDGGLPKWRSEGRPIEDLPPRPRERHFVARPDNYFVCSITDVLAAVERGTAQILDARGAGRFSGAEPEPREDMRSGHMPGAINVPYSSLLNDDNTFKDAAALKSVFEGKGVDMSRPIITSCGSGVTACILKLGLEVLGKQDVAVYDGSWAEWGARPDVPVATGA